MPELSTNDFKRVADRNGSIFFNQTTNKLDVRGSSFISRFVTWIKSKYKPSRINQEHKMATESFINEVERSYGEAVGKYMINYRTESDDLSQLYELGKQNKPLAARHVRRALKNLDIIKSTLADTQLYLSPQQCNKLLIEEMSNYPELAGPYTAGKIETEKLISSIQKAIMEEVYQHGGINWETTGMAIAKDVIAKYVAAQLQPLTWVVKYSHPDYCQEQIVAKLSKDPNLIMRYYCDPNDIERLNSNIQEAIVSAYFSSPQEMTETKASAIADQMITQHTDALVKELHGQNAVPAMKPMSKSDIAAEVKATKEDSAFAEITQQLAATATAQKETKQSAQQFVASPSTSEPSVGTPPNQTEVVPEPIPSASSAQATMETPLTSTPSATPPAQTEESIMQTEALALDPTSDTDIPSIAITPVSSANEEPQADAVPAVPTAQTSPVTKSLSTTAKRLLKNAKDKKIQLSSEVKTQVRGGEIRSLSKLIKAHNQSVAKRITTTSLQTWYKENYPKLKSKMPKEMQDSVLRNTQQLIQPLQFFVDEKQARSLALQVMSGYLKRHTST